MNPLNLQQLSMLSFMRMPGEGCLKVPPGLLWIAQMPQGAGRIAAPRHLRILHGIGDRGRVRQGIVEETSSTHPLPQWILPPTVPRGEACEPGPLRSQSSR